jgi:ATP-dependent Zn protease
MKLLEQNRDLLDMIADTLIEKEKISGLELIKKIKEMKPDLIRDHPDEITL